MIFTNQEITCPGCGQKQLKQLRVHEIGDKWSIGDVSRCRVVDGHDKSDGCGKLFVISTRTQLTTKVNMVEE